MPPSFDGHMRPDSSAIAPPWLNPPSTMRSLGMPEAISEAIREWNVDAERIIPASSSLRLARSLKDVMSYQPGMRMPMFWTARACELLQYLACGRGGRYVRR